MTVFYCIEIDPNSCLYVRGDFNARGGNYHNSWPDFFSKDSVEKRNRNRQRVLELCRVVTRGGKGGTIPRAPIHYVFIF